MQDKHTTEKNRQVLKNSSREKLQEKLIILDTKFHYFNLNKIEQFNNLSNSNPNSIQNSMQIGCKKLLKLVRHKVLL